ncbi:MAG: thiolase family protein [Phycisphaeraceae bacterium]|nr:thiolase family protein [Phycisphaerae bacterium]MBX3393013.1 thiolase family protein [Phycisphaeraceae bacterium]HRJ49524.1 thiolase family protein [Phycisphaerales bacterium]
MSSAATIPVILSAKRTPIGRFFGGLSKVPSPVLGSYAIRAALEPLGGPEKAAGHVDEAVFGCVLQAGLGQNPARQAGLKAGLPDTLSAKTINKVCGSGLEAVIIAAQSIKAGDNQLVLAGGFENMTAAPHFARVREGVKYGPAALDDHMAYDGLRCAFECWAMGNAADHIAAKHDISRAQQDRFSVQSHHRAAAATAAGHFKAEIATLTGEQCLDKRSPGVAADEGVRPDSTIDSVGKLRPAFTPDGSVTAANASQISDGAAALVVSSLARAEQLGIKPIARITAYATSGVAPKDIFAAPISGITAALDKAGLTVNDIDLFEINEAFAAQVLANIKALNIPEEKLNIAGGGIALGHPIGASGARVLTTLIHQLHRTGAKRGVAALCLGGGNAVAMIVET